MASTLFHVYELAVKYSKQRGVLYYIYLNIAQVLVFSIVRPSNVA